ncbi:MAG: LCP family protein [Oscillospiraceae bacterium]
MGDNKNKKNDNETENKNAGKSENKPNKKAKKKAETPANQQSKKKAKPKNEDILLEQEIFEDLEDLNTSQVKENKNEKNDKGEATANFDMEKYLQDDDEYIENISEDLEKEQLEDISSNPKKGFGTRIADFWKRKDNTGKKVAIIVVAIILIVALAVGGYFMSKLSLLGTNDDKTPTTYQDDKLYEDVNFSMMNDITDAHSLNELLRSWATNKGEKMSSKNVVNILLLGVDSKSNLSDSMMLISLNKSTKKISLVSFYRDSYTYLDPPSGKPRFAKLNSAFSAGGAQCTVQTIENNYKIKIDDYAYVDYNSFPKIIDSLGGVKLNVQPYEAAYMNREYGFGLKSGNITLTGEQALKFSRIRHSDKDGDVSRTRRQRAVITSIMNSMKSASVSQINNMITTLFPNIKTSMSKTEVLSFGTQALTNGWLNFEMAQANMPSTDTSKGGYVGDQWVWICDYPGAAYQLQMMLYGKSNIKLAHDRVSPLDLKPTTTLPSRTTTTTTSRHQTTTTTKPTETTTTTTTEKATTEGPTTPPVNTTG